MTLESPPAPARPDPCVPTPSQSEPFVLAAPSEVAVTPLPPTPFPLVPAGSLGSSAGFDPPSHPARTTQALRTGSQHAPFQAAAAATRRKKKGAAKARRSFMMKVLHDVIESSTRKTRNQPSLDLRCSSTLMP